MPFTDPYFEQVHNKKILRKLRKKFGPFHQCHVDLNITSEWMINFVEKLETKPRRGEVVMVIPNKQSHIWLHTKEFYGDGVYRLMTGGIKPGEKPQMACRRETFEETGFKVDVDRCLAVITYTLMAATVTKPFVSYVFTTQRAKGKPSPTDDSEAIAGFTTVPVLKLGDVAETLETLNGERADWGKFRAVSHRVVQEYL